MKKILLLVVMGILLVSCWIKDKQTVENKNEEKKVQEKKLEEKFWGLTIYIKADITDKETKSLQDILEQRKTRLTEIKEMIENATKETKDETYNKIVEMRKNCMNRILPYVSESKKDSFKKYCEKTNFHIKKKLDEL